MINREAIPKFDIKSDIKFDISIKPTTWIGHYGIFFKILSSGLMCYSSQASKHGSDCLIFE